MKKSIIIFILLFIGFNNLLVAQRIGDLKGIYYQAVAVDEEGKEIVGMDVEGKPLYNKTIGVRFSITKGLNGNVQWEETHTTNTDKYGLFTLVIGSGTKNPNTGFARLLDIPWIDADQFLKVEIATKNDGNYKLVSNQQFMAVPYSFYTDDIADNAITTDKILDLEVKNQDIANETIDLTAKVTNQLPVKNGGTGQASLATNGFLLGTGTDPVQVLGPATNGQIPIGVTNGKPVLSTISPGKGININNTPGRIEISVGGINSSTLMIGTISNMQTFLSPVINLQGASFGDIIVAAIDADLKGCHISAYVTAPNQIRVSIFNASGAGVNLGNPNLRLWVVD